MKKIILVAGLIACTHVQASSLDLSMNDESFQVRLQGHSNMNMQPEFSWLHHQNNGDIFSAGMYANSGQQQLSTRLGAKAYYFDSFGKKGWGVAPGAQVTFHLSQQLRLEASAHYAPKVLSFGDAVRISDLEARVVFAPMANAELSLGYRKVKTPSKNTNKKILEEGGFLAMGLKF